VRFAHDPLRDRRFRDQVCAGDLLAEGSRRGKVVIAI
jgi:hypothetical protein